MNPRCITSCITTVLECSLAECLISVLRSWMFLGEPTVQTSSRQGCSGHPSLLETLRALDLPALEVCFGEAPLEPLPDGRLFFEIELVTKARGGWIGKGGRDELRGTPKCEKTSKTTQKSTAIHDRCLCGSSIPKASLILRTSTEPLSPLSNNGLQ